MLTESVHCESSINALSRKLLNSIITIKHQSTFIYILCALTYVEALHNITVYCVLLKQECIPVGCVPTAHNHMGGHPGRNPLDKDPLDRDPPDRDTPLDKPPLDRDPGQRAPWTETPLDRNPSVNRVTDRCKNITLP